MANIDTRDKTQIVIFQSNPSGSLIGHLKYLYLTLLEEPELQHMVLLVTTNPEEFENLKAKKYPVAIWCIEDGHQHTWNAIARSKAVFIDGLEYLTPLELRTLVGDGKFINLWHGKDGKESGFKFLECAAQFGYYISVLNSIRTHSRMLSPGKGEHDFSLKTAFPGADLFNAPDIRTWGILDSKFEQSIGVDQSALKKVKSLSSKHKALWCPTYRDEQIPNAFEEISLVALDEFCIRHDIQFFIKPHKWELRLSGHQRKYRYSNLHFVDSSSDIYPLVKYFQTAITDYSSIAVDFMENNIHTLLFKFDIEKYTAFRKIKILPNSEGIQTAYSQQEFEKLLLDNIKFLPKQNTFRDLEEEKRIWIEFVKALL